MLSQIKDINQTKVLYDEADGTEDPLILVLSEQCPHIVWKALQQGRINLEFAPNEWDDETIYKKIQKSDEVVPFLKEYVQLKQQHTKAALKYDQLVKRSKPGQSLMDKPEHKQFMEACKKLQQVETEYATQQAKLRDGNEATSSIQQKDFTPAQKISREAAKELCEPAKNAAAARPASSTNKPPQQK